MAKLTPEDLWSRLKFDYRVAMKMRSPVMSVTAYRSADDLAKRRNPIVSEEEGHLATHYLVDYYIRTLVGPDRYSDKTSVMFDLLVNGNYPYSVPGRWVVDSEMPWTPHFTKGRPICVDEDLWNQSRGRMLLGDLLVHVAKLLNFDEIPRTPNYGGYTPDAAKYWRTRLQMQPITPNLTYPVLPQGIINNQSVVPRGIFEVVSEKDSTPSFSGLFEPAENPFFSIGSNKPAVETAFEAKNRAIEPNRNLGSPELRREPLPSPAFEPKPKTN
ncbi:MAG TPA: hypothetical protein VF762_03390 [Blastocatellia bacterium]|jgi:hypothetical protein